MAQNAKVTENALTRFDPATVQERVKAKIKEAFVDLIDDAAWSSLVRDEMQKFFQKEPGGVTTSELQTLVCELMRQHFKVIIRTELNKPEWTVLSEASRQVFGDELKKLMIEIAPSMFANAMKEQVGRAIDHLRWQQ